MMFTVPAAVQADPLGWGPWSKIAEKVIEASLEDIEANPERYKERLVEFTCRYHQPENIFHAVYTGLSKSEYAGFSAWGLDSVLFREADYAKDLPFLYVEMDTGAHTALAKLNKFDCIRVMGRVASTYQGRPWIVIEKIELARWSNDVTEGTLRRARLGLQLFEEKKFQASAAEFAKVVGRPMDDPMRAQVAFYGGQAFLKAGEAKEAVSLLHKAWKLGPNAETGYWLGRAQLAAEAWSSAASHLEDAVEDYPTHAGIRVALATAYGREKQVRDCLNEGRASLSLKPGQEEPYRVMGAVLVAAGLEDEAIKMYREGLDKAPAGAGTFHWALGRLHYSRQEYDWAVNELELAKRAFPGNAEIHVANARALRDRGQRWHRAAAINFRRAFELDESLTDERLELALMFHSDGEDSEVLKTLKVYLERRKDDLRATVMGGLAAEHLGRHEIARDYFSRAEQLDGPGQHSRHLGFVLEALGKDLEAAAAYERAAGTGLDKQTRFEVAFLSSTLRVRNNKLAEAAAMSQLAHELNRDHPESALNYGKVLMHQYRWLEAQGPLKIAFNKGKGDTAYTAKVEYVLAGLRLGHKNSEQLEISVSFVGAGDGTNKAPILARNWVLARHGQPAAAESLRALMREHPEARLGMIELMISQDRAPEARRLFNEIGELAKGPLEDLVDSIENQLVTLEKKLKDAAEAAEKAAANASKDK